MIAEYQAYLQRVRQKLAADKVKVLDNTKVHEYNVDVFGFKHTWIYPANYDAYVSYFKDSNLDDLKRYMAACYDHAIHYIRGMNQVRVMSVCCSLSIDSKSKEFVKSFKGLHEDSLAGNVEHPVLIDLGSRSTYQYDDTPSILGSMPVRTAIDFTIKNLSIK